MIELFFSFLIGIFAFSIWERYFGRFFGQRIREEGPETHKIKNGTPTASGIFFILIIALFLPFFDSRMFIIFLILLPFFIIGFIDDFLSIKKGKNEGLKPRQKMILIALFSFIAVFFLAFVLNSQIFTRLQIFPTIQFYVPGILLWPFLIFVISGSTNAVNLTDGLDGLAALCSLSILFGYLFFSYLDGDVPLMLMLLSFIGVLLSFLWFNVNPARIFMGDVGSIGMGALLAILAIFTNRIVFFIISAMPFIVETLSVIIQVAYYKRTKQRIFKMSPLHHHFELSNVKETHISMRFFIISLLFTLLAVSIQICC
ncbi:MAG: phospho-N-acetylmuramoyl-pentapeptide-transferase [Thermodesulfobium narugense]|nr:MAG: phospho-N-acetylmuramoyl-pentapeptide-transferase [Thermodesulfobium narugense]